MPIDPDFRRTLDEARVERRFVLIECEAFDSDFKGIVQSIGDDLIALAFLDDRIRIGGVDILRLEDVSNVEFPAPQADFYESAMRLRKEVLPEPDSIDLSSWRGVLDSVSKLAPLVVIHREEVDDTVCEIGQVVSLDNESLELREIDPDADWDDEHEEIPFEEITRVGYGGEYEAALALVAGLIS